LSRLRFEAMASRAKPRTRAPLSRERVLSAAVQLADEGGVEAVTMRRLAQKLGVEAMSIYNHAANKEDVLDGMVDVLMTEINDVVSRVESSGDWKASMRQRILAAREVLLRHRWAPAVLESRATVSPTMMRYYDSLVALFREGGFSNDLTHHALHALGSRALGFTQELYDDSGDVDDAELELMIQRMSGEYPHLAAMVSEAVHDADTTLGWCDDQFEFEFALDLLLDGLERRRDAESKSPST
jgi:AcrR family transcriptional regulator